MFRTALLIASITLLPLVANAAPCAERSNFLEYFEAKYAETPVSMGLTSDGKVLEVLASERGTWTMIVTLPTGQSCGFASGEGWSKITRPEKLPGEVG